jgi:predicted DNA-binding protein with PD1-like motif
MAAAAAPLVARARVSVIVTPVNDAPVAVADTVTVAEDTTATGNVLTHDVDVDGDTLTVTTFTVGGVTKSAGQTAVISGVGSLSLAQLRFAGAAEATTISGDLEILSLAGTLSADGAHLHITIADSTGAVIGGHLCHGSLVRTTAELVLGLLPQWRFRRGLDPATGCAELQISPRTP